MFLNNYIPLSALYNIGLSSNVDDDTGMVSWGGTSVDGIRSQNRTPGALGGIGMQGISSWGMELATTSYLKDSNYNYSTSGVVFGTGTTPPAADDHCLSGDVVGGLSVKSGGNVTCSRTRAYADGVATLTIVYTITNTTDSDMTIGEIGMVGYVYITNSSGYSYYYPVLFERSAFDDPIIIPANGGVGQVTYEIRIEAPELA